MAFSEADRRAMDNAAVEAENDLTSDCPPSETDLMAVANWWKKWFLKAGHKRLARILLQYADKEGG